jgi:hypothetical protein
LSDQCEVNFYITADELIKVLSGYQNEIEVYSSKDLKIYLVND